MGIRFKVQAGAQATESLGIVTTVNTFRGYSELGMLCKTCLATHSKLMLSFQMLYYFVGICAFKNAPDSKVLGASRQDPAPHRGELVACLKAKVRLFLKKSMFFLHILQTGSWSKVSVKVNAGCRHHPSGRGKFEPGKTDLVCESTVFS